MVIIRENVISVEDFNEENCLTIDDKKDLFKDAIFFDLEHYVYKKPICIGVFGSAYYDKDENSLKITQYMIENKYELKKLLRLSKDYFKTMIEEHNKKYIVTFSGNNDFTVINYLYEKHKIDFKIEEHFKDIDLQKYYEKFMNTSIGLKNLESKFSIVRESEIISGSNLAKTFSKIMKDEEYFNRMPADKKEKILLYNMQDVVSLFYIYVNWNKYIFPLSEKENLIKYEEQANYKVIENNSYS
ncbi:MULTISPECIES: ribonuclease H-like domain-containing protein [Clostridium]|uniref:ribonuclease H-like domain-containing protein n=1 Tax=Clostridium TaxID=1485 RepID=UPI001A9C0FD2|nr:MULTISPECIES: ribonuclease H-like domain-containing protein [Clostridium]MDU1350159.1 ribonuclease H-like domain-containing protein [Clostridium argentinense]